MDQKWELKVFLIGKIKKKNQFYSSLYKNYVATEFFFIRINFPQNIKKSLKLLQ